MGVFVKCPRLIFESFWSHHIEVSPISDQVERTTTLLWNVKNRATKSWKSKVLGRRQALAKWKIYETHQQPVNAQYKVKMRLDAIVLTNNFGLTTIILLRRSASEMCHTKLLELAARSQRKAESGRKVLRWWDACGELRVWRQSPSTSAKTHWRYSTKYFTDRTAKRGKRSARPMRIRSGQNC